MTNDPFNVLQDQAATVRDVIRSLEEVRSNINDVTTKVEDKSSLLERLYDLGGEALLDQIENLEIDLDDMIKNQEALGNHDVDELIEKAEEFDKITDALTNLDVYGVGEVADRIIELVKGAASNKAKDILKQFAQLLEESK